MKKIIKLTLLGIKEELTIDFKNLEFQDTLIKVFKKVKKEDYFDFHQTMEQFEPEFNIHFNKNYIKVDEKKLEDYIIGKIKSGKPDDIISPFKKITLLGFTRSIFSSILWNDLGFTFTSIILENYSPLSLMELITDIEMKGVVTYFKSDEYNAVREELDIDNFVPKIE